MQQTVPFTWPHVADKTNDLVTSAIRGNNSNQGDGPHTVQALEKLRVRFGTSHLKLVTSCSSALDISAVLSQWGPGDEVIVPNYTFTSTASSIAMRGATPIFVDVGKSDLNVSPSAVQQAITGKTRGVIAVHYGGIPAEVTELKKICDQNQLLLIEDAAQALGVQTSLGPAGTVGDFGCISFHATKNIQCGEGGLLICRSKDDFERAEIVIEKGTNRSAYVRGEVDKYTWRDIGSSWLPADYVAAYLEAQLEDIDTVNASRVAMWQSLDSLTYDHAERIGCRVVSHGLGAKGNGHIFAYVMDSKDQRSRFIAHMRDKGIVVAGHYVALHSSFAGSKYGKVGGDLTNSIEASEKLVRIPTHQEAQRNLDRILDAVLEFNG